MSLPELAQALLKFRDERNWAQFHTLRHLIVSLNLEAAELLELTQWKTDEEMTSLLSEESAQQALSDECADVLLYLLLIADKAGINLEEAKTDRPSASNALPPGRAKEVQSHKVRQGSPRKTSLVFFLVNFSW
jgi:NTP pyrophosphatase (non-canonical NTP hydrolase)